MAFSAFFDFLDFLAFLLIGSPLLRAGGQRAAHRTFHEDQLERLHTGLGQRVVGPVNEVREPGERQVGMICMHAAGQLFATHGGIDRGRWSAGSAATDAGSAHSSADATPCRSDAVSVAIRTDSKNASDRRWRRTHLTCSGGALRGFARFNLRRRQPRRTEGPNMASCQPPPAGIVLRSTHRVDLSTMWRRDRGRSQERPPLRSRLPGA